MTGLLNVAIVVALGLLFAVAGSPLRLEALGFFLLLVTLLITLYDRYRPEYLARHEAA